MTLSIENTGNGTGIPIIFLHAFPLDQTMWKSQSPLARNFRMISVDLPGFGASLAGNTTMRMEDTARAIMRTLEERGVIQPAVFAGLSMGGYVLLQILRLFPQRVRAAVLASTRSGSDSKDAVEKRMENVALVEKEGVSALCEKMIPSLLGEATRQSRPDVVDEVRAIFRRQPAAAVTAALRGMAERTDTSPILEGIACPALVLSGAQDTLIKSEEMEAMAKRIPKAEFQVIEKAGHLLNMEAPEQFNDLFLHFLKRHVL